MGGVLLLAYIKESRSWSIDLVYNTTVLID